MYKKAPTEKAPIKRNDEKMKNISEINRFIDILIDELSTLKSYKLDENSFSSDVNDVIIKSDAIRRSATILNELANREYRKK